jgi:predicted dehydrogenase
MLHDRGCAIKAADIGEIDDTAGIDIEQYDAPKTLYDSGVDGVVLTTPNRYRVDPAVAALQRDIDLLIEPPLAHTVEDAAEIAAAAENSDARCFASLLYRCLTAGKLIREFIENGRLGEVYHIEAYLQRRRGIPALGDWYTSEEMSGGGALLDVGIHPIDTTLYWLSSPRITDSMTVSRMEMDPEQYTYVDMFGDQGEIPRSNVNDSTSALIEFENNTSLSLEVAWATNVAQRREFIVRGENAGAHFELGEKSLTVYTVEGAGVDHYKNTEMRAGSWTNEAVPMLKLFIEHLETGNYGQLATAEDALTAQRIVANLETDDDQ